MKRLIAVTGLVAAIALSSEPAAQSPSTQSTYEQRATRFVDLLVKQDFVSIVASFDETLKAVLTEQQVQGAWLQTVLVAGTFRRPVSTIVNTADGSTTVTVTCEFERRSMDLQIAYGADDRVTGFYMRPTPPPWKPPPYATAAAYRETETTIGAGDWILPATLTMPVGTGPFPAVVLVHGSGPADRDESIGPNRPFKDLAAGLASRGIAVLRFDKRSKVYGAKLAAMRMTVKDESIDDAMAAVDRLRATSRIDRRRIVVLGHSLGGMLVPRIGAADRAARHIAGFIVMAGPARPLEESALMQAQYLAIADGTVSPAEQAHIDEQMKMAERIHALTVDDANDLTLIGGSPASYWLDLRGYDPPRVAKEIIVPMLMLQGERDYQVTMDGDYARWKAALGSARTVTWHTYPALDHLFMAGRGPSMPAEYFIAGHVDGAVIQDIELWIGRIR